jgi:hypothetical protein
MFQANQVFQKRKNLHQKKEVLEDKSSFFVENGEIFHIILSYNIFSKQKMTDFFS